MKFASNFLCVCVVCAVCVCVCVCVCGAVRVCVCVCNHALYSLRTYDSFMRGIETFFFVFLENLSLAYSKLHVASTHILISV